MESLSDFFVHQKKDVQLKFIFFHAVMKPFYTILLLIATSLSSYAQWRTDTFKTPYGTHKVTTYTPERFVSYSRGSNSPKQKFTVVFKGDSTVQIKARINVDEKPDFIRAKVSGKKRSVFPSDTKEIYRITPDGVKQTGVPADSCWLFKVVDGKKINAYSDMAMRGYDCITAIQLGNEGPIVPCNIENLRSMIGETDDPELQKMLKKEWIRSALQRFNGEVSVN